MNSQKKKASISIAALSSAIFNYPHLTAVPLIHNLNQHIIAWVVVKRLSLGLRAIKTEPDNERRILRQLGTRNSHRRRSIIAHNNSVIPLAAEPGAALGRSLASSRAKAAVNALVVGDARVEGGGLVLRLHAVLRVARGVALAELVLEDGVFDPASDHLLQVRGVCVPDGLQGGDLGADDVVRAVEGDVAHFLGRDPGHVGEGEGEGEAAGGGLGGEGLGLGRVGVGGEEGEVDWLWADGLGADGEDGGGGQAEGEEEGCEDHDCVVLVRSGGLLDFERVLVVIRKVGWRMGICSHGRWHDEERIIRRCSDKEFFLLYVAIV